MSHTDWKWCTHAKSVGSSSVNETNELEREAQNLLTFSALYNWPNPARSGQFSSH